MRCISCQGKGCPLCLQSGTFLVHGYVESNERYTPRPIIELARLVMGRIDFDPASSIVANMVVRATTIYTHDDDGLSHEWHGKGWCNPPYGRTKNGVHGLQTLFIQKGLSEFDKGNVEEMIFLLNGNAPYRPWFAPLRKYPTCFYSGDVDFWCPKGKIYSNPFGTVITYIGHDWTRFLNVFSSQGYVASQVTGW